MITALDGPAGSGKSTIAKMLAAELSFQYLDSGALYRTLTLWSINHLLTQKGISVTLPWNDQMRNAAAEISKDEIGSFLNGPGLTDRLAVLDMKLEFIEGAQTMFLNGVNISASIRLPEVTRNIGMIANTALCRDTVNRVLRSYAEKHDVIIDGRDIGTEVFPNADIKFYLDASVTVRARRRYDEQVAAGIETDLAELEKEIAERDAGDQNRTLAPLRKAEDAILIDTSDLTKNDVFQLLVEKINLARSC